MKAKREIFLVNTISKVYELIKIIQNEKNNSKMSEMQAAGRKEKSAIDNLYKNNEYHNKESESTKTQHIRFLWRCC